jgi:bifunctional non-homologous end joining protein LigD
LTLQGLRPGDKSLKVVGAMPTPGKRILDVPRPGRAALPRRKVGAKPASTDVVAGVGLSHPDKVCFPEAGVTKRELAQYYERIAPRLLPHLEGRPLSLVRCPGGRTKPCFYQKHADPGVHNAVSRVTVPEGNGKATYLGADSAAALVGLVQWGVIELHPWGSRSPRLDRPDRLIFDLDPDDALGWNEIVAGVTLLQALLLELKLVGFLKTTGGKGLHVVLPIRPTVTWDDAKSFTRGVADFLVRTHPNRFTAALAKERRTGKIFIDYLRNAEGATAIAPYSVRARARAPVATPIDWAELAQDVRFDHFNLRTVPERLARLRTDPWAAFAGTRQSVPAALRRRLA